MNINEKNLDVLTLKRDARGKSRVKKLPSLQNIGEEKPKIAEECVRLHKNFVATVSPRVVERVLKGDLGLEVSKKEVSYEQPYLIGDVTLLNNSRPSHSILTSS